MEIFKNYVRFDHRLYLKCKSRIVKHRRIMLVEHLIESVEADCMFPEQVEQHDNFFQPANEYEKRLWESCREMAKEDIKSLQNKSNGGKKSAEIKKQNKLIQPEIVKTKLEANNSYKPTEKEVLDYAAQQNSFAGIGGFACSQEEAKQFFDYYSGIGWCLPNDAQTPIKDWKPFLRKWVSNPRKFVDNKKLPRMSLKEMKEIENHIRLEKILKGEAL